jgi:transposase
MSDGLKVLKAHLRTMVQTLLRQGHSQREIERLTGIDRKTIRGYSRQTSVTGANSPEGVTGPKGRQNTCETDDPLPCPEPPASAPPAGALPSPERTRSACADHREWIEQQVQLGRNAQAIYQDLVDLFGFSHRYNSVKRFVRGLKVRDPERFDVLDGDPGEEAQVDFGQGALTLLPSGRYKRPWLFVMTLKYSGKAFRKVVRKADQQTWARLHEEAFFSFGGVVRHVVLDNLKQGVAKPDLYEPELNPVYAAMLTHYNAAADVCRVEDPDRKGTVENAIKHTQGTALKGRKFASIEAQNAFLADWEERWAAPRIHGRKKRQVMQLFEEERPALQPLPVERFRLFSQVTRTVDDAGMVQVLASYYTALPARLYSEVPVRIYENTIEILDESGQQVLRTHARSRKKGHIELPEEDRIFNPSRQTARLMQKAAKIGPNALQLARDIFARLGRSGQRALYGLTNLPKRFGRENIERACLQVMRLSQPSYQAIRRILERQAAARDAGQLQLPLQQHGPHIRDIGEYMAFWDKYCQLMAEEDAAANLPPTDAED